MGFTCQQTGSMAIAATDSVEFCAGALSSVAMSTVRVSFNFLNVLLKHRLTLIAVEAEESLLSVSNRC